MLLSNSQVTLTSSEPKKKKKNSKTITSQTRQKATPPPQTDKDISAYRGISAAAISKQGHANATKHRVRGAQGNKRHKASLSTPKLRIEQNKNRVCS